MSYEKVRFKSDGREWEVLGSPTRWPGEIGSATRKGPYWVEVREVQPPNPMPLLRPGDRVMSSALPAGKGVVATVGATARPAFWHTWKQKPDREPWLGEIPLSTISAIWKPDGTTWKRDDD